MLKGGILYEAGIPEDLLEALNQWHKATWFTFEDQEAYMVHSLGVKPGDTLADVIFALCFATFHKKVVLALEQAKLMVTIEVAPPAVHNEPIPPDSVPGATPGCCAAPNQSLFGILGTSPSFPSPDTPPKVQITILPQHFMMISSYRWQQRHLSSCYFI